MDLPILAELEPSSLAKLKRIGLPVAIESGIINYIQYGVPTGDALQAIISNDLCSSFGLADSGLRPHLEALVKWLYWEVPGGCWKSREAYKAWVSKGIEARSKAEKAAAGATPVVYAPCVNCGVECHSAPERNGLCGQCIEKRVQPKVAEGDSTK